MFFHAIGFFVLYIIRITHFSFCKNVTIQMNVADIAYIKNLKDTLKNFVYNSAVLW